MFKIFKVKKKILIFFIGTEPYISHLKIISQVPDNELKKGLKDPTGLFVLGFKTSPLVAYVFRAGKNSLHRLCAPVHLNEGKNTN